MRNKWVVYLLALAVFLIGTIEYIISGILQMVAADLGITTSSAGMLVTAFALSAALGAPVVIAATIQVDRKKMLLLMLGIFILSSFLAYFSPSFEMMLVTRVIQGLSGGTATVIAMAVATRLVEVQHRGRAIGTILMGLSSSLVLGVPAGTFLSEVVGWRMLFILIGLLSLIPLLAVFARVPSITEQKVITLGMQLSILKNKKIVTALAITLFYIGGYSTLFTYIAPFLQANAKLSAAALSGILLLFGLCSFVGSKFGGMIADTKGPKFMIYTGLSVQAGMLLLLAWAGGLIYAIIPLIMIWMMGTWATSPAQQLYMVSLAPHSPDIALSVNTSFIQFGFAFGSAIGGMVISGFSIGHLGWSGFFMVLLALLLAVRLFAYNNKPDHVTV
ncbi:MFS transporter, DHA1 family, purine base/nucleoside efflux pump [Paenibacillus tianmuensis]|uniref:MFS transporter, DHA1 family, purine base/nucleoside efflux pump n=1 Tax=Paenibacillus tianmuensis TaxID=624147 RepID=A0A1G4PLJ6_9BACL|nr:MFS transporter [Paenibacillus tianmuensis]SCW33130.1 MFS transporter, DHA1 family, purine base/nucleoside efflux pump [Paenibacillus tianmuensis]